MSSVDVNVDADVDGAACCCGHVTQNDCGLQCRIEAQKPMDETAIAKIEIQTAPSAAALAIKRAKAPIKRQRATAPKFVPMKMNSSSSTLHAHDDAGEDEGKDDTAAPSHAILVRKMTAGRDHKQHRHLGSIDDMVVIEAAKPLPTLKVIQKESGAVSDVEEEIGKRLKLKLNVSHLNFAPFQENIILRALKDLQNPKVSTHW